MVILYQFIITHLCMNKYYIDDTRLNPTDTIREYALVIAPEVWVFTYPHNTSAVRTQYTFGEPLRLYQTKDNWVFAQSIRDDYCGWITKNAITTPKPQTTKKPIQGVLHAPEGQVVFVDTPGILQKAKDPLTKKLSTFVAASLEDIDAILYVADPTRSIGNEGLTKMH